MRVVPETESNADGQSLLDEKLSQKTVRKGCIIVITISVLVLIGCIAIWFSSFILTQQAITGLSNTVVKVNGEKVVAYFNGYMKPLAVNTKSMAREYHMGSFQSYQLRGYLYSKIADFGTQGAGFIFTKPSNARWAYAFSGPALYFSYQPFGYPGSIRDLINVTDGTVIKYNSTVDPTPYIPSVLDYYTFTMKMTKALGVEGVYGDPYLAAGIGMSVYYSQLIYDPVLYMQNRTKNIIGLSKCNIMLSEVAKFLSQITLLGNGYIVVAMNSGLVIGSNLNVPNISTTSVSAFNITDRNAGSLLQQLYVANNNSFQNLNSLIYLTNQVDGIPFVISAIKYRLENIEWNIYCII